MICRPFVLVLAFPLFPMLAGCQTVEEAATARSVEACTAGGYGPSSPRHQWCVDETRPLSIAVERQRRQEQIQNGLEMMAKSVNPGPAPKLTCVQQGSVTRCY